MLSAGKIAQAVGDGALEADVALPDAVGRALVLGAVAVDGVADAADAVLDGVLGDGAAAGRP